MKKWLKNKKGYTLVELMVVVTIMAILAATSTPVFSGYIKKAKASNYLVNCRAVSMAAESYFIQNKESFVGNDDDFTALEAEIEALTTFDVEILGSADASTKADYGVVVTVNREHEWSCEFVICMIEGDRWMFEPETGDWKEIN